MAQATITLETIGDLDGGAAALTINNAIHRAVADLYDRGEEDGKTRKVAINLDLTIKSGIVVADVLAEAKLPPYRTNSTACVVKHIGGKPTLQFQTHNPERADQPTFDALDESEE